MKKTTLINITVIFLLTLTMISCKKKIEEDKPESCNYELAIAYKWYNTYTKIDIYSDETRTKKVSTAIISPVGFLKVNPNSTYEIVSDDLAQIGTWEIDENTCRLSLSDKSIAALIIKYDILHISTTNLVIKRVVKNTVYTEHYRTADCPTIEQLAKQWNNDKIYYYDYNANKNTFGYSYLIYPIGYFKLNKDLTYNVVSNGVPLNGSWKLAQPSCMIDLDAMKDNARSFEIVKLTKDSLIIWRKDPVNSKAYLQYYLKD